MTLEHATPAAPRSLARYEICGEIARGGMGSVHLGRLRAGHAFEKWVAVKVIHPEFARDPRFVRMFTHEARLLARLSHPNLCTVFDFGEADGTCFLAMEYLRGETLRAVATRAWKSGGLPAPLAARIACDAARGLHAAHELRLPDGTPAGVVHRDVSPQNVFVTFDGAAKVLDFGIARSIEAEGTRPGEVRGNVPYMSPEQLAGRTVDRRSDVFSLGVVLWEVTTGRRLFKRDTPEATVAAVLTDTVPSPRSVRADYPAALADVLARALARDPDARFATAGEMARALEGYLAGSGAATSADDVAEAMHALFADRVASLDASLRALASTASVPEAAARPRTRPRAPRIALAALALGGVALAMVSLAQRRAAPAPTPVHAAASPVAPSAVAPPPVALAPVQAIAPVPAPVPTSPVAAPVVHRATHHAAVARRAVHARPHGAHDGPMRDFGGLH